MRRAVAVIILLAGCGLESSGPLPPPPMDDAEALLHEVVEAGIARDWDRLCALASGTCESELESVQDRAPTEPPVIVAAAIHQGRGDAESWTSGGILFTLCGVDGLGDAYESEVFVFDDGTRLIATAAVYWVGTKVIAGPGESVTVGAPPGGTACP